MEIFECEILGSAYVRPFRGPAVVNSLCGSSLRRPLQSRFHRRLDDTPRARLVSGGVVGGFSVVLALAGPARASKPVVGPAAYVGWPSVAEPKLSDDGRYAAYSIVEEGIENGQRCALVATGKPWRTEFKGAQCLGFTGDSRQAVVRADHGITIVRLGTSSRETIPALDSVTLSAHAKSNWLVYRRESAKDDVVLRNLSTNREIVFSNVPVFTLGSNGRALILQRGVTVAGMARASLVWVDLSDGKNREVWQGHSVGSLTLDETHGQLAFTENTSAENPLAVTVWSYHQGGAAHRLAGTPSLRLPADTSASGVGPFSADGSHIAVMLHRRATQEAIVRAGKVHVLNARDWRLASDRHEPRQEFTASLRISDGHFTQIEGEGDTAEWSPGSTILIRHEDGDANIGRGYWNPAALKSVYVMDDPEGVRKPVWAHSRHSGYFSRQGRYVLSYYPDERSYYSYDVASERMRNLTAQIPTSWTVFGNDNPHAADAAEGPAAWTEDDRAVLLYDAFDIWLVDPSAAKPPINLTNGFGLRHHIELRLAEEGEAIRHLAPNAHLILKAFNRDTKENGFFSKVIGEPGDPTQLTMGRYVYDLPYLGGEAPIKALHAEAYLVSRESATESRNYFFTTDFKSFTPLSDLHPERQYNWLTTELREWRLPDGSTNQGVLYKPEDFDPTKKYPVIFYYYEILSDHLHKFEIPAPASGQMDIPTFVSHGYLVFTPDIHYTIGHPMQSALNAVQSAAQYLSRFSWVDSTKLGLQGHSFGGIETDYIVTHSHLFAAANAASGIADFVSGYDSLMGDGGGGSGESMQVGYELTQMRIGATLWERPDLYIENSAIFHADQVTTPLLLMHTTNDGICLLSQAEELFVALRRLGKKAWMLQYDDSNHSVWGAPADDFSIRLLQFFDYYLKGAPPPKWMTEDLRTRRQGNDSALDLDT